MLQIAICDDEQYYREKIQSRSEEHTSELQSPA